MTNVMPSAPLGTGGAATLVEADALAATYPGARVPALASVTFRVSAGQRVAVLGPNGGGKSTLFRVLTGELSPSYGSFTLPAGRVALVPPRTAGIGQPGEHDRDHSAEWV